MRIRSASVPWIGLGLVVAVCAFGFWRQTLRTGLPIALEVQPEGLLVAPVEPHDTLPPSWPGTESTLFLRELEGAPVSRPWHIRILLAGHRVGDDVVVRLDAPRGELPAASAEQTIGLVSGYDRSTLLVRMLVGMGMLFLAGFLLHHRGLHEGTVPLASTLAFVAALLAMDEAGAGIGTGAGRWVPGLIWSYAYGMIAPAIFSFSVALAPGVSRRRLLSRLRTGTWVLGILTATAMSLGIFLYVARGAVTGYHIARIAHYALWSLLTWAVVALGVGFFLSYLSEHDRNARRRLRWLSLAYLLGVLPSFVLFILPRLFRVTPGVSDPFMVVFLLLVPVCLVVAVVRYQLLNISVTLRQQFIYGPATAIVYLLFGSISILIGYLLLSIILPDLPRLNLRVVGVLALLALLYHLLYEPLRRRLQRFLDRSFFRTKYGYGRTVRSFSEGLEEKLLGEEIIEFLAWQTQESISPAWAKIVDTSGGQQEIWRNVEQAEGSPLPQLRVPFQGLEGLELWLGPKQSHMAYHVFDRALVETLVGLASNVLQREMLQRRLFAEAAAKEALERELQVARSIQERLLPEFQPQIGRYEIAAVNVPSAEVGGDYYDVVELSEGRWLIAIGDVVGHGIPAALLMANLLASLRSHAQYDHELQTIALKLNDFLFRTTDPLHYSTMFCGILDPGSGAFSYVNAGHPPPLQLHLAAGESTEPLELVEGGIPLGMMRDASYTCGRTTMEEGDLIFLYTDGVTEAENSVGEQLGREAIVSSLRESTGESPEGILRRLRESVVDHTGQVAWEDDLTMMAILLRA